MNHQKQDSDERINVPPDIITRANEGHAVAQLELGKVYLSTTLVENNYQTAFTWILNSAEQGNREAQFRLGDLYALGHGAPKNLPDAYQWYTKAAIQGYKKALIRIHNLYQEDIKMHGRGQINSEEKEWTDKSFKKKNKIRELNEYRLEQKKDILNGAITYYTNQFKHYQSSSQSDPTVQLNIAFLYQHGYGVKKCTRWAFEYYTKAAEQGDIDAQYNLGNLYQKHPYMKFNYRNAFEWYTKSAQGGNIAAQKSLAYFYLKGLATGIDYNFALSWYTKAAESGDSESQVILGKLYRKGDCIKQDLSTAVKWYSLAARQGNIVAQNCLFQLHQRGKISNIELNIDTTECLMGTSMNERLSVKLSIDLSKHNDSPVFKQLKTLAGRALVGDGHAMYEIGLKYYHGDKEFMQDKEIGIKWIKNAANANHKDAQFMMAKMYETGDSLEQDYNKATIWYKTLARQKDANARYNVGTMYEEGLGVRQDYLEASKWYTWAAEQGDSDGQFLLGMLRLNGVGLRKNEEEALEWINKSASQRNTGAIFILGYLYLKGEYTVEKNVKRGFTLLEFAAENGSTLAQLEMARIYLEGDDVEKDIQKCIKYYTIASEAGNVEAQYRLAIIYLKGDNVQHDYLKAYDLFKRAKDKGYTYAKKLFEPPSPSDASNADYSKVLGMFIEVTEKGIDNFYYLIGSICELRGEETEKWYLAALKNSDSRAGYRLGLMYERGNSVTKNIFKAIDYYNIALLNGSSDACYRLACIYLDRCEDSPDRPNVYPYYTKAYKYYTKASIMGHSEACSALMICKGSNNIQLSNGDLSIEYIEEKINEKTKIKMLEIGAEKGYTQLQYQLGLWYRNKNDNSNAFKWLSFAADLGISDAYYRVGVFYEEGLGIKQDYRMAANMYHKAVKKDHADACYRLGQLYQYGNGVELNYLLAYQLYKKAEEMNHVEAHKVLNITLKHIVSSNGDTVKNALDPSAQEYQDSLSMCKFVAENGDTEVQFQVGFAYEHSFSEPNYVEAFNWYSMAAQGPHKESVYHLGLLYEEGLGVSQDYQKAIRLYEHAGQLGSDKARYQLGGLYHYGRGVEIDPIKAIAYYTFSANFGNPKYQCWLGTVYREGKLVHKNLLETLKWYTKAYLQGYDDIRPQLYAMYEDRPYQDFFFEKMFRNLSVVSRDCVLSKEGYYPYEYHDLNNQLGILCSLELGTNRDLMKAWGYFTKKYYGRESIFRIVDITSLEYGLSNSEKYDLLKSFEEDEAFMNQMDQQELYLLGETFFNGVVQTENGQIALEEHDFNNPRQHIIIDKDYSRAFRCLKRAADKNHLGAMYLLGIMYVCGYGVDQDPEHGKTWFAMAEEKILKFVRRITALYSTRNIPTSNSRLKINLKTTWRECLRKLGDADLDFRDRKEINEIFHLGLRLAYEHDTGVKQNYLKALRSLWEKLISISFRLGLDKSYEFSTRSRNF